MDRFEYILELVVVFILLFILIFGSTLTSMLQIYTVGVSVFLGGNKPSRTANVRGDISINFSCDPEISSKLVREFVAVHVLIFSFLIEWSVN